MSRISFARSAACAALVATSMTAGAIRPAHAGAWTQDSGSAYLQLAERFTRSDHAFDAAGESARITTLSDTTTSFYGEYGFTDRITGVLYLPFYRRLTLNRVESSPSGTVLFEGDSASGVADIEAGVRVRLAKSEASILSAGLTLGLPAGSNTQRSGLYSGDGEFNQRLSLLAGHSFRGAPVYVSGELGYDFRSHGYSDELHYSGEVGGTVAGRVTILFRARGIESRENGSGTGEGASTTGGAGGLSSNDQRYLFYGPQVTWRIKGPFALFAGAEAVTRGRSVLDSPAYSGGLVWEF